MMQGDDLDAVRGVIQGVLWGLVFWAAILVPIVVFYP